GRAPLRWSGEPPAGLTLLESGRVLGLPTAAGQFTMPIQVEDANGRIVAATLELTVEEAGGLEIAPPAITLEGAEDGGPTAPRQVTITSQPSGQSFTASVDVPWL